MQLVGGLEHDFYILLWLSICWEESSQLTKSYFSEGVGQPPTRQSMRELLGVPLLPITNVAVQLQSVSVGLDHFPWLFHCGKKNTTRQLKLCFKTYWKGWLFFWLFCFSVFGKNWISVSLLFCFSISRFFAFLLSAFPCFCFYASLLDP